jgi:hypothetical protein
MILIFDLREEVSDFEDVTEIEEEEFDEAKYGEIL